MSPVNVATSVAAATAGPRPSRGRSDSAEVRMGYAIRELTLGGVLAHQARRHPDKTFLHFLPDGRRYDYAACERESNRLAHGLIAAGIRHGETVAVMMDNSPEALLVFLALGKIGAVNAPVNTAAKGELLRHFLALSESVAIVVDAAWWPRVQAERAALPLLRTVIVRGEGQEDVPPGAPGLMPFAALVADDTSPPAVAVRFTDLAMLAFTSGTTGPSKAARYTHAAVLQGAIACAEAWGYRDDDVYYVCLPFFHSNAVRGSTYVALVCGATVALAPRFSASGFWSDVRRAGATTFNLLGSMLNILWAQPPGPGDREHRVRFCRSAPMPAFAREFEARFGLRLVTTYGLSDFGTPVAFTTEDPPAKLGSAGRTQRGWEVRIVDADDFDVPAGETGEIVLRCNRMWVQPLGYHRMPAETVAAMRNGWFHTGDLGRLDGDGYLWFVGRRKDAIRRRGENISAWEVERAILDHPAVGDVAVYGIASEMSEEEVVASVVLKPGAHLDPAALIDHCAARLAYFMVPRYLDFVPDLPRTPSQKVEKFRLREAAERARGTLWDREAAGIEVAR